ncbi:3-hydroxyisobutyrate dehydrogenase-like beta-hydroxyacid dehydrogenase [Silvimonas terrae]|uniref:3-hydroxyisobutyrate dehydrogenase-like beta-hydroxyacid dehydrogenase n=1 Tax=Silvimonas terrae TaxID=300266 RepID=A0A840RAQ4_9NEIS|nr:NAD(P)-dependent oxidoreductase [Silvimonas terrae]MBB5189503.1 3-hydroxyisobutyrate dehydrogenase-like beta-hydroxyacid dehydrogenase [Silvimonas terrae]
MKIGLIGLGSMGVGIGHNLIVAGHTLTVYNRSKDKADGLLAEGAAWAATPRALAQGQDAVITMVADDHALQAVTLGEDGLLAGLAQNAVHISMSTVSQALVESLVAAHARHGSALISAPVFGRPDAAAAGKLFVVAAGQPEHIARVRPALEAVGQKLFEVGEQPQQAAVVKLIGNFLISCVIEGLGEGAALAEKAGVDPEKLMEVLTGTIFGAPVYQIYGKLITSGGYKNPGFALPLGAKDNRLVLQAAEAHHVPLPFASVVRDRFVRGMAQGLDGADWSAIASLAREDAGLKG